MNQDTDHPENDDVVIIEQRDKRAHLYLIIAAVLGLALGGLLGSSLTANKWQATYQTLEQQYQTLAEDQQKMVAQVEETLSKVDDESELKVAQALKNQQQKHDQAVVKLHQQIKDLQQVNQSLEQQITSHEQQRQALDSQNNQLNRQADIQATMLERSRELFQQELKVKIELESLEKEREALIPRLAELKKACDLYLEGKSWDVKTDSCDRQDEAQSRLSQVDQMIRVHQMDLKQMKSLSEQLGLN